jgi:hypothetical protein
MWQSFRAKRREKEDCFNHRPTVERAAEVDEAADGEGVRLLELVRGPSGSAAAAGGGDCARQWASASLEDHCSSGVPDTHDSSSPIGRGFPAALSALYLRHQAAPQASRSQSVLASESACVSMCASK